MSMIETYILIFILMVSFILSFVSLFSRDTHKIAKVASFSLVIISMVIIYALAQTL